MGDQGTTGGMESGGCSTTWRTSSTLPGLGSLVSIVLNSVLVRRDIGYRPLYDFNSQLESMCNNFGVTFVEANCCVGRGDLARDGVHFGRRGVSRLGSLLVDVVMSVIGRTSDAPSILGEAAPLPLSTNQSLEVSAAPQVSEN